MLRLRQRSLLLILVLTLVLIVRDGLLDWVDSQTKPFKVIKTFRGIKRLMAPHMSSLSGRLAGVASALRLGLLSVATPSVSKAESIAT